MGQGAATEGPSLERLLVLDCDGEQCMAVYSRAAFGTPQIGVVIVVGGPQYRVGSHRQFTLLARDLARSGIPVLRFDYRGLGDSDGDMRTFESIDEDIHVAIGALQRESGVARVVLWGLCDGASAALMCAEQDPRVVGIVAANPWAKAPDVEARTRLRHYYLKRVASAEFWRKLLARRVDVRRGGGELLDAMRLAPGGAQASGIEYLRRMHEGWRRFGGSVLFLLSGRDYTAREFETWVAADAERVRMLAGPRSLVRRFDDADHTFSTRIGRDTVSRTTIEWIGRL